MAYSTRENKRKAKQLLVHYIEYAWKKAGLNWKHDNYVEVGAIMDHVFDEMADLEERITKLEADRQDTAANTELRTSTGVIFSAEHGPPHWTDIYVEEKHLGRVYYESGRPNPWGWPVVDSLPRTFRFLSEAVEAMLEAEC